MKVLLIMPPSSLHERYGKMEDVGTLYPPMGLVYIAAAAKQENCEVRVLDSEAMGYTFADLRKEIAAFSPNLIGMQTFVTNLDRCFSVAKMSKDLSPGIKVCLGGAQATLTPRTVIENEHVDFVIAGEGDVSFRQLIRALKCLLPFSDVPGLLYKIGKNVIENRQPSLVENLDTLPLPARELFPMHCYHSSANLRGARTLQLITARGCPFRCAYCAGGRLFGRTFRHHGTNRVIQEIRILLEEYGADAIQFYDDTFTLVKSRVYDLCSEIIRQGLKFQWSCFTRVNLVDESLLGAMREAGCYQIFFGIESGVQRLLDLIQKDQTLDQARAAVRATKKSGIEAFCSFMLALPSETREESFQTIQFAIELDPDYAQFPITTPFPGTHLYDLAKQHGTIITDERNSFTTWDKVAYLPAGRTEEEIIATVKSAYRQFYLRPGYIVRNIKKLRTLPMKKIFSLLRGAMKTMQ